MKLDIIQSCTVQGTDADRENSLNDAYMRDSEFPSTSIGESFYHILESGQGKKSIQIAQEVRC